MSPMAKPMQARQAAVTSPGTNFWRFSCDIAHAVSRRDGGQNVTLSHAEQPPPGQEPNEARSPSGRGSGPSGATKPHTSALAESLARPWS
jgi:hypothetical protein